MSLWPDVCHSIGVLDFFQIFDCFLSISFSFYLNVLHQCASWHHLDRRVEWKQLQEGFVLTIEKGRIPDTTKSTIFSSNAFCLFDLRFGKAALRLGVVVDGLPSYLFFVLRIIHFYFVLCKRFCMFQLLRERKQSMNNRIYIIRMKEILPSVQSDLLSPSKSRWMNLLLRAQQASSRWLFHQQSSSWVWNSFGRCEGVPSHQSRRLNSYSTMHFRYFNKRLNVSSIMSNCEYLEEVKRTIIHFSIF